MRALLVLLFGLAQVCSSFSATLSSTGSGADVQSKINSAQPGDIITIPSGTFSGWAVTLDKAVTLQGAGTGKTTIKGNGNNVILNVTTPDNSGTTRLTGLKFDGGEHTIFIRYTNGGAGLIDHCEFVAGSASEMIHNEAYGPNDNNKAKGWSNDVTPGSADAVYVEDCVFSKNPLADEYFWGTSALQGYYGSKTVMRHNTFNYCQIDQHGTSGMIGARWFEFYDNTFFVPDSGGNQSDYIVLRGGSGVVFNNTKTGGHNDGGGSIHLYDENGGSSPAYLGRGWKQNPSPVYLWGNSSSMAVYSSSDNVQSGRDYFKSDSQPAALKRWQLGSDNGNTTYAYNPFAYPHPAISGGSGPVPTPIPTATATPAPTASVTPPPVVSTKFRIGDSVKTSPNNANIRSTPAGDKVGTQPVNTKGKVICGPSWGQLPDAASGVYWWDIDFPSGADGWVGEDNLVKSTD